MSIPPTSINFKVTNQYVNEIRSSECSVSSILAKVSVVAFPIIALITLMVDLVSDLLMGSLSDKVVSVLNNNKTTELKKISQLFDVMQDISGRDIVNTIAELASKPKVVRLMFEKGLPLAAYAQQNQNAVAGLIFQKATEEYSHLGTAFAIAAQSPEFAQFVNFAGPAQFSGFPLPAQFPGFAQFAGQQS